VLLAFVYYRLNRTEDGKREQVIIQKLNAEQQAQQPGVKAVERIDAAKPPANPRNNQMQQKERR